jgi:hypothetical protein
LKRAAALLIILLMAMPVLAQNCSAGLPCGQIPWDMPFMPELASPTPLPTFFYTATPTPTMTPTNFTPSPTPTNTPTPTLTYTPTSTPTVTPFFDTVELENQIETLQAIIDATPITVDIDGTPVTLSDQIETTGEGIEDLFSLVKGILGADWGPFSPMYQAFLLSVVVVFLVVAITYSAPIIGFVFGIVRKIYTAIMDFIPS